MLVLVVYVLVFHVPPIRKNFLGGSENFLEGSENFLRDFRNSLGLFCGRFYRVGGNELLVVPLVSENYFSENYFPEN